MLWQPQRGLSVQGLGLIWLLNGLYGVPCSFGKGNESAGASEVWDLGPGNCNAKGSKCIGLLYQHMHSRGISEEWKLLEPDLRRMFRV